MTGQKPSDQRERSQPASPDPAGLHAPGGLYRDVTVVVLSDVLVSGNTT